MRDSRTSAILNLTLGIVSAAMAVSCFFLPEENVPWLSSLLALLSLAAVAVSMGILNYSSYLFTSDTKRLFLPYLICVLSVPGIMDAGPFHIAALLTVWTMFLAAGYINSDRVRMDFAFGSVLIAGAASMAVPCLVYAQIVTVLYCLYVRNQEPLRYLLSILAGAGIPWLYVVVWSFIFPGLTDLGAFLGRYAHGMELSLPSFDGMTLPEMSWAVLLSLLIIRSLVFVIQRRRERNKAQKNAFGLSVALSVVMFLAVFFCGGLEEPLLLMSAGVPAAFAAYDLFINGRRAEAGVWLALLMLSAVAVRLSEFFPDIL